MRILRDHRDETLVGGAEQIARHADERLGPSEARAARQRNHVLLRVHGVERAVGTEGGLCDVFGDRVHATAAEIEGQQFLFGGGDKEELGLGVEANHPLERRQPASQHARDLDQAGEPIQTRHATLGSESDRHTGGPGGDAALLVNLLWLLGLRRRGGGRLGPAAPERHAREQEVSWDTQNGLAGQDRQPARPLQVF